MTNKKQAQIQMEEISTMPLIEICGTEYLDPSKLGDLEVWYLKMIKTDESFGVIMENPNHETAIELSRGYDVFGSNVDFLARKYIRQFHERTNRQFENVSFPSHFPMKYGPYGIVQMTNSGLSIIGFGKEDNLLKKLHQRYSQAKKEK